MVLALLATIHDPDGNNYEYFKKYSKCLNEIYDRVYITVSDKTDKNYINLIKKSKFNVKVIPKKGAADARRNVIMLGLTGDCDYYHYCDFDRILTWIKYNIEELKNIRSHICKYEYLILGRTESAFLSHPIEWIETENLTNKMFSYYFEKNVDITAGSCAFSKLSAQLISKYSQDIVTDGEWPIIIMKKNNNIGYMQVDGLRYYEKCNGTIKRFEKSDELLSRVELSCKICKSIASTWNKF